MKFISVFLITVTLLFSAGKREKIDLALKDLTIKEFLKITSKIYGKNILMTQDISGKIDFISTKAIYKDEIADILISVLETKGFTVIEEGSYYKVVRSSIAAKENLPVVKSLGKRKLMTTQAIRVKNENIDIVVQKIRHLLSPSAKLVTMKESNTMLVSEYPRNIKTIQSAIEALVDDTEKNVEFVKVKYAKVSTVHAQINAITKAKIKQNVETSKFTLLKDDSANSLIVVGTQKQITYVKELVEKLDQKEDLDAPQIEIIKLTHTDAKTLATSVTTILTKTATKGQIVKPSITSDDEMNALIVVALIHDIKKIKELVKTLDTPRQQVYVKATIVEVNENKGKEIGFNYGNAGPGILALATNHIKAQGTDISDSFQDAVDLKSAAFLAGVGLNLLENKGVAETLSEPSILCINNKPSDIYVGKTISIQTASNTQTTGGTVNSYKRQDVGLSLTVKPRISSESQVALEVSVQVENLGSPDGNGQPTTTKSRIKTVSIVKDGEPVVLGGMTRRDESEATTGVPFFSKIPFLGRLFRNNNNSSAKQNLLIIVTPYIIQSSDHLAKLRERLVDEEELRKKFFEATSKE
ncbi:MAG: hypothetical protein OIF32_03035 [Campylobacterales bacterium]|nr:hypothetical protein [Campylobacterales bacterium]